MTPCIDVVVQLNILQATLAYYMSMIAKFYRFLSIEKKTTFSFDSIDNIDAAIHQSAKSVTTCTPMSYVANYTADTGRTVRCLLMTACK